MDDKRDALEANSGSDTENMGPTQKAPRGVVKWLNDEVEMRFAYVPLVATCLCTGLTDSSTFAAYATFVSMQTGNTVFIGLGTSGQDAGWARALCSLGVFVIGCLLFSRLAVLLGGPKRRGALIASWLLQTACVLVAAAVVQVSIVDGRTSQQFVENNALGTIALLSFQAAGQIVNSRGLGVNEVPTVVITSLLCDLFSDVAILAPLSANAKRNRRIVGFLLTLLGAIAGGWLCKSTGTISPSLWFVFGIKFVITVGWLFWTRKA